MSHDGAVMRAVRILLQLLVILAVFVAGFGYRRWYAVSPAKVSGPPPAGPSSITAVPATATDKAGDLPMGTIQISPQKQQLIGVNYGLPSIGPSIKTIRAVGKIAPDEQRIAHVHTRVDGWIDKVFVDFTGKVVNKNQPLLTMYSPDLLATQEEFLLALKSKDLMKASTLRGALSESDSLLAATRRRLKLWDLGEAQIDEVARTGKPLTNITVYSPVNGYVTVRNAFPNQRITPDTELYTITDLSRVWIMADVFEAEASLVQLNQPVNVTLAYGTTRVIKGTVDNIQPQVDPMTRTVKVRIGAENPGMTLKPDMFVEVNFTIALPSQVTVPADAVLDAGLKKTVFVDRGNGYLEPREVEIGEHVGDRIEILRGLKPDERIVTSGTFLIDSESQMKSAASGMGGMPGMPGMSSPKPAAGKSQPPPSTPARPDSQPKKQDMKDMPGMGRPR